MASKTSPGIILMHEGTIPKRTMFNEIYLLGIVLYLIGPRTFSTGLT